MRTNTTINNKSDNYILHVYKKQNIELNSVYNKLIIPYKIAYGKITIKIYLTTPILFILPFWGI